jgi:hypothetical protein
MTLAKAALQDFLLIGCVSQKTLTAVRFLYHVLNAMFLPL